MGKIHAPYNFVPTPDGITFPEGALDAVQDIPYEDGFSGTIHVTITAETPVFVRNGHSKEEQEKFRKDFEAVGKDKLKDVKEVRKLVDNHPEYCSFNHTPDGSFFIPATTFKGTVREVLSILSRGKMRVDPLSKPAIQREIGATRDRTGLYTLLEDQSNIQAGWIKFDRNRNLYVIVPANNYYRVSLKQLDESLHAQNALKSKFSKENFRNKDEWKTADFKYRVLKKAGIPVEDLRVDFEKDKNDSFGKRVINLRINGDGKGRIVLTGQSSGASDWGHRKPRTKDSKGSTGKYYDFIFEGYSEKEYFELTDEEFYQYDSVYGDSVDWKRLKNAVNKGKEYPVFFRPGQSRKVKDFGLTLLYKLPYQQTPLQIEQKRAAEYRSKHDMAERIFGFISDDAKGLSVRGRVQFQHLMCKKHNGYYAPQVVTLNSPKLTYYPIYIRQKHNSSGTICAGRYSSYNDGQLAGWKRYVGRNTIPELSHDINVNIDTVICPLNKGAVFEGDITFHNLREFELGALLSALTFHNTDGCYHQIGQGKPYGFGKIKVDAELVGAIPNKKGVETDLQKALHSFEFEVNCDTPYSKWFESDTIKELFALSSRGVEDAKTGSDFTYMKLDITKIDGNDFVNARKENQTLLTFSELLAAASKQPDSCLTTEDLDKMKAEKDRRLQLEAQRALEIARKKAEEEAKRKEKEAARKKAEEEAERKADEEKENRRKEKEAEEQRIREEEEKERQEAGKREKYGKPLEDVISIQSSFEALANNVEQWVKMQTRAFSSDDSAIVEAKIKDIWSNLNSKKKKAWKSLDRWKTTFKFLDSNVVENLFKELVG